MKTLFLALALGLTAAANATGRVVMGIPARIASLDPFSLTGIETFQATSFVLEPLARLNPSSKELIPWLAESWTLDKAHNSFRVKLRREVRFQNGQTLTPEDVKFTFDAYYKAEYKGEIWRAMWEDILSAKVIDAQTVEFQMNGLHYLAFENLLTSLRILPRTFYAPYSAEKFRTQLSGSGPFQLSRFEPNQNLELRPYPGWWGKAHPDFVLLIKTVNDSRLAEQMLEKGELDEFTLSSSADAQKLDGKHIYKAKAGVGEGIWLDLNLRRELFQSRKVRRALLLLWDRARVNSKLYGGQYELALDGFSPKMTYYPAGTPEAFRLETARELLAQEGWIDQDHSGLLSKGRREFRFQVLVHGAEQERWVSLFQSDAEKAGVKVDIKRVEEDSQWWQALKDGKFDAVAGDGGVSESPHASTWNSDGFYNFSGYKNPEVDRLLNELEREFDLKKRHALESRIIALIRGDSAQVAGLYLPNQNLLLSARLEVDPEFPLQAWRWRLKH